MSRRRALFSCSAHGLAREAKESSSTAMASTDLNKGMVVDLLDYASTQAITGDD
jgi:hypothetical protein